MSTLTSVFAVIVVSIVAVNAEIGRIEEVIEKDSMTLGRVVGGATVGALVFDDKVSATETLYTLANSARVLGAVIYNDSGKPFVWYKKGQKSGSSLPADMPSRAGGKKITALDGYLEYFEPIMAEGTKAGTVYMKVDMAELD